MISRRLLDRDRVRDRGSISLMVAVLAVGLLAVVGLVVDGGGKAKALARADDIAAAAGRCAAGAIDINAARQGAPRVDPNVASARARACLTAAGSTGSVTVGDSGTRLTISADITYQPVFLSMVGVSPSTVSGRAVVVLHQVQDGQLR